jgi:DNA-binding PucR family transcriptional regulator
MTLRQAEVIVSLAKNNLNARAVARSMFLHYQTVYYNIRMIQRNTGLNPLDFYDLCKLLPEAHEVLKQEVQK